MGGGGLPLSECDPCQFDEGPHTGGGDQETLILLRGLIIALDLQPNRTMENHRNRTILNIIKMVTISKDPF